MEKCFVCPLPIKGEGIPIGHGFSVCSAECFEKASDEGVVTAEKDAA
jgi:hypothetical protein